MRNLLLRVHTAEDIDAQVEKIFRGLGSPKPPLSLDDVRELLKLDRRYYSSRDDSVLRDVASRIYVASKQILARPTLLIDAIRKADLKALYIPDQKRILLDKDLPILKHRWNEAHEIGHSIIPWHMSTAMLGDDKITLSEACNEHTESEANYAAGRLLFFRDQIVEEVNDVRPTMKHIRQFKESYGNTMTCTLWRVIESSRRTICGAISEHPHRLSDSFNEADPLRYFIRSPKFARSFSSVSEMELWKHIRCYCSGRKGGPLGESEITLIDDNGEAHDFHFETFFNSYDALTLGVYLRKRPMVASF